MNSPRFVRKLLPIPLAAFMALALGTGGCGDDATGPTPLPRGSGLIDGVVRVDGSPMSGTTAIGLGSDHMLLRSTVTDVQGRFAFAQVEEGSYDLWVTPPESYTVSSPDLRVNVTADRTSSVVIDLAPEDTVNVPPQETGTLAVSAHDGQGPVEGAYVSVTHHDTGTWGGSGRTGEDGRALLEVAPGSYDVTLIPTIWYEVNGDAMVTVSVTVDRTTDVAFSLTRLESLPPGQLMVYADADSLPVAGVTAHVFDEAGNEQLASGVTDERGRVAFSLEDGAYAAGIEVPDGYVLYPGQENPMEALHIQAGQTTWVGFWLQPAP